MSKTIVLPSAGDLQSRTRHEQPKAEESHGFERVDSTMNHMMTNLARHGDMLHGDLRPQRRSRTMPTQKERRGYDHDDL